MNNLNLKTKKLLILPFLILAVFSFNAPRAQAVGGVNVPTWDLLNIGEQIAQWAAGKAADVALQAGKISLDSMAYMAGQLLYDQVTNNIVSWAKGGFNGSPSFAVDQNKFFMNLADAASGGLASQIKSLEMCDFSGDGLFRTNLANSIDRSTRSVDRSRFADRLKCPFSANVSPSAFYGDFNKGGWRAFESSLRDNGNPFGASLLANRELATRKAEETKIQEQKLNQGGGFLDMVDTTNCPNMPADVRFNVEENADFPPEAKRAYQQAYCTVSTPAKVVESRLNQALGSDMNRVGNVDNISKITGAILKGLTTEATNIFKQ